MTRPQYIRADTIDLQDQNAPSAQDHTRQPTHPSAIGAGPPAPHQAEALQQYAEEEQQYHNANAWQSGNNNNQNQYQPVHHSAQVGSNDNYNQNNNVGASQHSGHNGEDGDMADADDDSMDDEDMMDKISSSPSIDDGQSPVHVRPEHWPLRSSSLLNLRDLQTALSSSPSLQDPGQANAAANRFATLFRNAPPGVSVRHARQTVASGSPLRLSSSPARMIPVVLPNTGPRWPLESSPAGSSTPHRTANNIINQEPGSNESGSSTNYWTIPIARQNFGPRWPIESSPGMAFPSPQHRDGRPNSTPSRDARWPLRESSLQLSSPGASVVPNNRPGFSIVRSPVLALSPPNDRRNWLLESSPERSSDDLPPMQGSPLRRVQHQRMDSSDESFTSNDGVPRAVPNTGDRWPIESSSPESERPIRSIANVLAHASQQSQQSQQGMPVLDGQRSATFGERPLPPIPTQQSLRARAHAVDRRPFMPTTFTRNAVLSSTATRPRQPSTAPGDNERYITESSVNGSTVLQEASRSTLSVDSQATERQRDIGEGSVNEEGESEFTEAAALVGSDAGTADGSLTEHSESGNAGFAPVLGYDADIDTSVDSSNQSISEAPSDASTGEPPVRTMGRSETIYFSPARTMSRSETVYFSPERGMPRSETLYFSPRQSVAISEISGASSPVLAPPTTMPGSWIDSPQHSPILPPERPSTPDSGSDTDFQSVRAKSPRRAITSVSETVLVTPTRSNRLSRPESQVSITSNFSRSGLITGNTTEPIARLVLPPLDANTTLRPPSTPPTPQFDDPHGNYHIINFAFLDSEPLMPEFVYELVMSAPKDRSKRESLLSVSSDLAGFYGVYEDFQRMAEEREKDLKEMEKEHAKLESDLEEQSDTESKESTILDIHSDLNPLCRNIRPKDDDESSDSGNEVQTTHGDDLNSEDYTDEVQTGEEDTFDESEVGSFTDDELDTSELALTRTPSRAVVQHSDECSTSELEENLKDSQESLASYESDPSYDDQYEEEPVDEYGNPLIAYDGYDSDDSSYSSSGQEDLDVDNVPPAYLAYGWAAECLQDPEDIDFEFVYALHTFVATVEGQANATKGDTMVLLDDSNSYWWLVRVVKDSSIGYLPAEHIETPTERLARLNKHRNIDLSSAQLADHSDKPINPIKKALTKRKAKTVTFNAQNSYLEASDQEYSSDEEEDKSFADLSQSVSTEPEEEEITVVEPERAGVREVTDGPSDDTKQSSFDELRSSEDNFEGGRSRNGTIRNTDSFYKDDSVETRKISLTPGLLRDDSSTSTRPSTDRPSVDSNLIRGRQSLEKLSREDSNEKSKDKKGTKDKKEKEKKSGLLGGLFKRKDKKKNLEDEDPEELIMGRKASSERAASPQKVDADGAEDAKIRERGGVSPQRHPSKLQKRSATDQSVQKLQPLDEDKPLETSNLSPTTAKSGDGIRLVQPDSPGQKVAPTSILRARSPSITVNPARASNDSVDSKSTGSSISRILSRSRSNSEVKTGEMKTEKTKPEKLKPTQERVELDQESDSEVEEILRAPQGQQASSSQQQQRPVPGAFPDSYVTSPTKSTHSENYNPFEDRLSESPVDVSAHMAEQQQFDNPPALDPPSPASSPSPELMEINEMERSTATAGFATTALNTTISAVPPGEKWNDAALLRFFDDGTEVRDLLTRVMDVSNVQPAGPDHPYMKDLFKNEKVKLKDMEHRLDNLLHDFLDRHQQNGPH